MHIFPQTVCQLSRIFNTAVDFILAEHSRLITDVDQKLYSEVQLRQYARAVREKGSTYPDCIGFLDGTVRPICRPTTNQKEVKLKIQRLQSS